MDTFAGIGRTTNNLQLALVRINLTHPQLIRIGMLFGVFDIADGKISQLIQRIFHALHFQPKISQRINDVVHRCVSFKMLFKPR